MLTSLFLAAALTAPCARAAWIPLDPDLYPSFADDLPIATVELAADRSLSYFEHEGSSRTFAVGGRVITAVQWADALRQFLTDCKANSGDGLGRTLSEHFDVYRSTALFTGYYLPVLEASLKKKRDFKYPLYKRPSDLVEVDVEKLKPSLRGERLWGRVIDGKLEPYLSRDEIDYGGALEGKDLEIAWLKTRWDALDAQIQGSAVLKLSDSSEKRALFDGTNGLPFKSPARALVELGLLTKENWSVPAARAYLEAHPQDEGRVFASDARYAFFKLEPAKPGEGPVGTIQQPLTDERSLAVDATQYPLGSIAYYVVDLPQPGGGVRKAGRFALMQDTGGAIVGPNHVDVYIGRGQAAFDVAGRLKTNGWLYLLVPKR